MDLSRESSAQPGGISGALGPDSKALQRPAESLSDSHLNGADKSADTPAESQTIGIIIPVYNCRKWLPRCIRSAREQTYSNLEILVIDDGSTDGSDLIGQKNAAEDSRVRFIRQRNSGVAITRTRSLELIHSDIFMFLDSDDWLDTSAVEKAYAAMTRENCDMVFFGMTHTSLGEKPVLVKNYYPSYRVFGEGELLREYIRDKIPVSLPAKLYRKELFDNIVFPSGRFFEDVSVMHEVYGKVRRGVYIPEQLYLRRQRPGSLSKTMLSCKKEKDNLLAYLDCLDYLVLRNHPDIRYARAKVLRTALAVLAHNVMMPCLDSVEKEAVVKAISENGEAESLLPKRYRRLYDSFTHRKIYLTFYGMARFLQQAFKKAISVLRLHLAAGTE